MHHLSAFFVAAGVNAADTAAARVADTVFSDNGTGFVYTDPVVIRGVSHLAASATRARWNSAVLNRNGPSQIWPVNRSATPPSPPRIMDLSSMPILMPRAEPVNVLVSNNLGAATEATTTFIWLTGPTWSRQQTPGQFRLVVRATGAVAIVGNAWSGPGTVTFPDNLLGGWYAVNACYVQSTTLRAFRLVFPRAPMYANRAPFRPGHLASAALGDLEPYDLPKDELGTWGAFHSFEPLQIEVYGDTTGASTQEIRLDLAYLGEGDPSRYPLAA